MIPAYAGNALPERLPGPPDAVHPRMRGERTVRTLASTSLNGSSPHARGTPQRTGLLLVSSRFIPACAGNAQSASRRGMGETVHPRMRGERLDEPMSISLQAGSSPHARGTPRQVINRCLRERFIPACAGNACEPCAASCRPPVHPRMRGERLIPAPVALQTAGSSPHARGTPNPQNEYPEYRRFIPACAGNAIRAVEPRVNPYGSSPHARGTPS